MTGIRSKPAALSDYDRKILVGCSMAVMLILFGLAFLIVITVNQEREAARYPGAILMASHSNYNSLPTAFGWDDAYRTTDSFVEVYNWYSRTFGLGAETRGQGRCSLLEGTSKQFALERSVSIFICNTSSGQMVFVSRFTYLK